MTESGLGVPAPPQGQAGEGRALASPFAAIVGYTLRGCLPAKRWWGVLLPCVGAVLFGAMTQVVDNADTSLDTYEAFGIVAELGLFGLVLPLTCLVIGDAVMGADIRAGTFPLTWLSPVPFRTIVLGRWLGGWIVALVTIVPALALAALVSGVSDAGEAAATMALAGMAGSAAYIALFIMIGALARRSAVWSLAIVFLGERLLVNALSGIAQLSPMWEASQVYAGLGPGGDELVRDGTPQGWAAVVRLAIVLAVTLFVASRRLRRLTPTGGDE
jgi:ABC-type transport system involved in multi-copper enzyme maturation permease subunit